MVDSELYKASVVSLLLKFSNISSSLQEALLTPAGGSPEMDLVLTLIRR